MNSHLLFVKLVEVVMHHLFGNQTFAKRIHDLGEHAVFDHAINLCIEFLAQMGKDRPYLLELDRLALGIRSQSLAIAAMLGNIYQIGFQLFELGRAWLPLDLLFGSEGLS